ncbi:MAG: SDR family oxidoreductase [Chloroflexi bacterium]|nr:SDR family oxidoreductase [Chloroflexota bacterium]
MITLDSFSLKGKYAIVTGSGQGIGKGIAEGLASLGASVAIAEMIDERRRQTVADIRARGHRALDVPVDVRHAGTVEQMVQVVVAEFGRIDILVNNPGGQAGHKIGPLTRLTPQGWDDIIRLNATSVYLVIHEVAPVMIRQGGGAIVNIASIAGLVGHENLAAYGAAKAAIVNMTEALAGELGPHKVRVNCVSPGTVQTPSVARADTRREGYAGYKDPTIEQTPLGRKGSPDDIAAAVAYLASDAASFVTGQNLVVDGGRVATGRIPVLPIDK